MGFSTKLAKEDGSMDLPTALVSCTGMICLTVFLTAVVRGGIKLCLYDKQRKDQTEDRRKQD